ncbi:putative pantothenate protein [Scedosporium apiospermum]|uniref:Putative pantothenate protein n=1 Tax=Pseudallescheria apiosperma TaxID=563466 RepID=A0A084GCI1_PSEDA|nr:putative pantothenate protein [Scedosporium apiospermum]KEZ45043.1 putative pantothenate protein [Scedosporium apiospermum]
MTAHADPDRSSDPPVSAVTQKTFVATATKTADTDKKENADAYVTSDTNSLAQTPQTLTLRQKFLAVVWDSLDKSPEERAFVAKADWWILSYCCISYFVKYLDQTNISNAYVSGMREDLKLTGNDLNYLTTWWNVGYILGQLPSQLALTRIRPSVWLPTLELIWSFIVMGMAGAKNVKTLHALRFFTGFLEASAYPGIMTLLGNWYTPSELGKRACIFQASSSAAQMFSGYLQAALYKGMDGRAGLRAWQWLFIFDGIIGVPICLYGYFAIPDAPTGSRARWLKPKDRAMAVERMEKCGREPMKKLTWRTIRNIVTSWPVYLFCSIFIAHVLGIRIYSYFNLWLKATRRYTTEEVNVIPTAGYALQICFTLTYAWTSDAIGRRWPIIIVACLVAIIGTIILSVWPEDNIPAMMAGWLLTFCETGAGALIITWINEILSHSAEERALVIGVVETLAFTFQAWVPLFVYNTGQAPHFPIGYEMATMFFGLEIVLTLVILYCVKKWPQGKREREEVRDWSRDGGAV